MKAKGLDDAKIAELAQQNGYELPTQSSGGTLSKITKGVNSVFAGGKVGEAIGTLGGYAYTKAKDKIKGTNEAQYYDLSAPSPLQVGADVLSGAAQVAGAKIPVAGSILGKAGQFGALGAVGSGAKAIAEGRGGKEAAQIAVSEGVKSALIGATFGVLEKGLTKATQGLNRAGEKIQYRVINPKEADIKDGFKLETVKKYDLGGSLQDTFKKTNARMDTLSKDLNNRLGQSKVPVDMNTVYEKTLKRLTQDKLSNFGTNTQVQGAADKLREEIVSVVGKNGITTIPEAQQIKRAAGHFGAWNYQNTDPAAKASERVYNTFYNELKMAIEEASPAGVKEINKQLSELIPVANAVIRRIPVAERNATLSLPDMMTLVGAAVEPRALALTALNFAQKSGNVGKALAGVKGLGQGVVKGAEQITQAIIPR